MKKSARYYAKNKEAREKKKAYDTEYHKSPKRRKYRAALNKKNRDEGTYGNGDGKDVSHKKDGGTTMEGQSSNRARNGMAKGRSVKYRTKTKK